MGSSMIRMRAFVLSALAISTSCCLPIESVLTIVCGSTSRPTMSRYLRDSRSIVGLVDQGRTGCGSRPRKMLAPTVRLSARLSS